MYNPNSIQAVSDADLLCATRELARKGSAIEADILVHIGEVEDRKLYAMCAYPSMFAFCVDELGFSEDAVYTRLFVARAARELPAIIDALRLGQVHLTGLRLLVPHLKPHNVREILAEAAGKSKRQIEKLVARLAPQPDVPSDVRKLPARSSNATSQAALPIQAATPFHPKPQQHRAIVAPLSENTYKIQFTASQALHDKLRRAEDLLRHRIPDRDVAAIFEKALDLLIERVEKERFAVGCKPRGRPNDDSGNAVTRHIPAAIRREVFERDGGRCTFTDERGHRCEETGGLEFDHVDGFARKPVHSMEDLRLRCRAHNQYAAEQMYGRRFMERARARRKAATCSGTSSQERLF
jgi:hypothetical protein